ncbi:hypothetical protein ACE198_22310 [Neobacillus sp. KR4-4]|uniref:hypothetical protein n=1 Tax=Neobacillus sp. KR4-4 TaxID=3344872 RepID=UPI0035CA3CC2
MSIMKSEHLKKKISNYNLIPLEISSLSISDKIHLNIDVIEDFLKFASDTECKYVYYYYTYYNFENYIIPADYYNEYSGDFKAEVRKYNQNIKKLNFDSPMSLTLFVLQNGTYVGIKLHDLWIENQGISVADVAIEEIEHKFYREIKKISADKKVQRKEDVNELREIIFNDPEFKLCKNQALSYGYLLELLQKEDMMKYDYLVQPYGYYKDGNVKWFMDVTWELFRERERKQKK